MLYYYYLKRGDKNYLLTQTKCNTEIRRGMKLYFSPFEVWLLERTHPHLKGLNHAYIVTNVYRCNDMGGVFLEDIKISRDSGGAS